MTRRAAAFTLIEIMIATILFAGLMAMYYDVFTGVMDLEQHARESRAFSSVGPAILDLIEDDADSLYVNPTALDAFPLRGLDQDLAGLPADRIAFIAQRGSIHQEEFYGHDKWLHSPINEVGYRLDRGRPGSTARRLYRRESYYVDESPLEGGDYYEVYDRVAGFDIHYVGFRAEESERSSQEALGRHQLETFESWDTEQRKAVPTALIVTLTVEAPQLSMIESTRRKDGKRERRTFVRILRLIQADDIPPAQNQGNPPGKAPANNPATNRGRAPAGPRAPGR